ncbi:MAG: 5-(carboxyamino)imidazole ribonucleotide mutase [Alphaproteobacteria bacterium]|nr:5-(carboxyamino)imidazole ribonucleotide mutase [Alphaproteobacteria bacterium]
MDSQGKGEGIRAAAHVAVIMGSQSDWPIMEHTVGMLDALQVPCDVKIISAHRTPDRLYAFAKGAKDRGFKIVIAGAGGAAHLPGMTAALTPLPVFGVPVPSGPLVQDSLLSIVQMPCGAPVGTMAIGKTGAINAALLSAAILALNDDELAQRLAAWRQAQSDAVAMHPDTDK